MICGISSATKNTANGWAKSNMTGRTSKIVIKYNVDSKVWKIGIMVCLNLWKNCVPIECIINHGIEEMMFSVKIDQIVSLLSFLEASKYPGSRP